MKKILLMLAAAAVFSGCGEGTSSVPEEPAKKAQTSEQERNIFVELEQTTDDPALRNAAYEEALKSETLTGGYLGEVTPELEEDFGVQSIEFYTVTEAIQSIYGDFHDDGILYLKNSADGAEEPGVWVGIKNPDERADELARRLQVYVDEGKIVAKYIHLFVSEYSDQDNQDLMYEVSKAIKPMRDAMPEPDRVANSISVDTITRTIEIGHDFLTEEQMKKLKNQFNEYEIAFVQEGRMLPLPGEPDVEYPDEPVTKERTNKGSWVMDVSADSMLIVSAVAKDFSENGGDSEYYGATYFSFPNAEEKLKIGQRVIVEASGPIMESYPGQGSAKFVTVLPAYQPDGAELTEEEVVRKALEKRGGTGHVEGIRHILFDKKTGEWTVTFVDSMEAEPTAVEIRVADQEEKKQ